MDESPNILIVEDNPSSRRLIVEYLQSEGYNIFQASNGQEALEVLGNSHQINLVVLDIMMPIMNGYQVLQNMRANDNLQTIPVVVISAAGDIQSVVQCFELGAEDYLYKPINRTLLQARIRSSIERHNLRQRQLEHLLEINRLKDQFVNTITHEMKNPIALITGYVELMLEDPNIQGSDYFQFLKHIRSYTQQMNDLVQDLLDLSRIQMMLSLEYVTLDKLVDTCLDNIRLLAQQKDIELHCDIPEESILLHVDEVRIQRVFNNLLSNAIKYTPPRGEVRLQTYLSPDETDKIRISVCDTGFGIPEEDIDKIFDTFYRVRQPQHLEIEGTGLGLTIARSIIEQHGGEIWVESTMNQGSCFYFTLPLAT